MPVTFLLPKAEFAAPSWEPRDCSIRMVPEGVELFCHFSGRRVAIADTVEEADAVLKIARIGGLKKTMRERGSNEFCEAHVAALERTMTDRERGVEMIFAPVP